MMHGLRENYFQEASPPKAGSVGYDPSPVKLLADPLKDNLAGVFTAPAAGLYQFVLFGPGGNGWSDHVDADGGAGALAIRWLRMARGETASYLVGGGFGGTHGDSTVTFRDRVMTAGAGGAGSEEDLTEDVYAAHQGAGGMASGGDLNLSPTIGATQAPSYGAFPGGTKGTGSLPPARPGGPGWRDSASNRVGAPGQLVVTFISA